MTGERLISRDPSDVAARSEYVAPTAGRIKSGTAPPRRASGGASCMAGTWPAEASTPAPARAAVGGFSRVPAKPRGTTLSAVRRLMGPAS
jgi:hypothetical protein